MTACRALFVAAAPPHTVDLDPDLYCLFNGQNGDNEYKIFAATRTSGAWSNPTTAAMTKAGAGWMSQHVKDPWVMAGGLIAYTAGYNGTGYQVGRWTRATTSDPWTPDSTSTPTLGFGSSGQPDQLGVAFPTALNEPADTGHEWKMWYRGTDAAGLETVCYADSTNGTSWTRRGRVLTIGSSGTFEDVGVIPSGIGKDGATYYLFYNGRQNPTAPPRWQGTYATFTDPLGTYTKAGTVTLPARYNDAGTSQSLTSNTASGSAVVHVGSTAAWHLGESMMLIDSNSESHSSAIVSIDSGTQVTLADVTLSTFATADGAVIRPAAFNSVFWRSILPVPGGGWQMFGTEFQALDDLSPGGHTLREGSGRWTASALSDVWTRDYATGLIFPLYPRHTGAHQFSAENPSVILAP